jgi:hypothetical protein
MGDTYKLGILDPDDREYLYPDVWASEQTADLNRLVIAPRTDQIDMLLRLIEIVPEPIWVLYVLVVPRGGGNAGHYQSQKPQTRESVREFLKHYKTFFEQDGRHDLWIASSVNSAMLVYDRHNLIYGYGPLDEFAMILSEKGLTKLEKLHAVHMSKTHAHHYNGEFDKDEREILDYWPWNHTPLSETDEN